MTYRNPNTKRTLTETILWRDVRRVKPKQGIIYLVATGTGMTGVAFLDGKQWRYLYGESVYFNVRYFAEWPKGPKGGKG
jgi:hypothetical protein